MDVQVKRVVIIGTSVLFFGTNLSNKTKIGMHSAANMWAQAFVAMRTISMRVMLQLRAAKMLDVISCILACHCHTPHS